MNREQQTHLKEFTSMYGHNVKQVIDKYRAGGEPAILLSDFADYGRVTRDMKLVAYSRDDIVAAFDANSPSVTLMLQQFDTLDASTQAVLGLKYSDCEVLTSVLQIQPRVPNGRK